MMIEQSSLEHYPAVLVGLGGTGTTTLRYLLWMAEQRGNSALRKLFDGNMLRLLAIDTDAKSNDAESLADETVAGTASAAARRLPMITPFIHIDTDKITHTVEGVRQDLQRQQAQGFEASVPGGGRNSGELILHRTVAEWFPLPDANGGDEISVGQSKGGAGQWRPLGRVGFFNNAASIHDALTRAVKEARVNADPHVPIRIHVICSLAGGTGSGMFWDVAFMARTLPWPVLVKGMFLLGEPFADVDRAKRIEPNSYAALKELATLKNWRQSEPLIVDYPIGDGLTYVGKTGGEPAFDYVYLYQAFKPAGASSDIDRATIATSCYQLAQNVAAQLRKDLFKCLDVAANNERGDVNCFRNDKENAYVFSTTGTAPVLRIGGDAVENAGVRIVLDHVSAQVTPMARREESGKVDKIKSEMKDIEGGLSDASISETGLSKPPLELAKWIAGIDEVLSYLKMLSNERKITPIAQLLAKAKGAEGKPAEGAEKADENAASGAGRENDPAILSFRQEVKSQVAAFPHRIKDRLRMAYDLAVPQPIRKAWADIIFAGGHPQTVIAEMDATAAFQVELEEIENRSRNRLGALAKNLRGSVSVLEPATRAHLESLRARLADSNAAPSTPRILSFRAPKEFFWLREAVGALRPGEKEYLTDRVDWLIALLTDLRAQLEAAKQPLANDRRAITRGWLATWRQELGAYVADVIRADDESYGRLDQIQQTLAKFQPDALSASATDLTAFTELVGFIAQDIADKEDEPTRVDRIADYARQIKAKAEELRKLHAIYSRENTLDLGAVKNAHDPFATAFKETFGASQAARTDGRALFIRLFEATCGTLEQSMGSDDRIEAYLRGGKLLTQALTLHCLFGTEPTGKAFLRLVGGREQISRQLKTCASTVFEGGHVENRIHKINLVVVPPRIEFAGIDDAASGLTDKIHRTVSREFEYATLGVIPEVPKFAEASTTPLIYLEDMFRAGREIRNIGRYHAAYTRLPPARRRNFHLFRGADDFEDLVNEVDHLREVQCGNPGCTHNIRDLPRTALVCPGCDQPIRNRCGNASCAENSLKLKLERVPFDVTVSKDGVAYDCPTCGNEIRTYWWRCTDHPDVLRRTDETICTECRREYIDGRRRGNEVQSFSKHQRLACPGCEVLGIDHDRVTRIPHELRHYYEHGVTPQQEGRFSRLIQAGKLDPHLCSHRGHRHFLFPTMPDRYRSDRFVHVYRVDDGTREGRFIMPGRPELVFYSCYHCGYPIDIDTVDRRWPCDVRCPRCTRQLRKCYYCSDKDMTLFEPWKADPTVASQEAAQCDNSDPAEFRGERCSITVNDPVVIDQARLGPDRCPRCRNLMYPAKSYHPDIITAGLRQPGFCRNIFQCRAGSMPWTTASDYRAGTCAVCGGSHPSELLPFDELERHVARCPLCLILIGKPSGAEIRKSTLEEIRTSPPVVANAGEKCVICGCEPHKVLEWIKDGKHYRLESQDAIDFLQTIKSCENDNDVFNRIVLLKLFAKYRAKFSEVTQGFSELLQSQSAVTFRGLQARLRLIEQRLQQIAERERQR